MSTYDPNTRTESWWNPPTRPAGVYRFEPAAATAAQPTPALAAPPPYAWSAESVAVEYPTPPRATRSLRPAALIAGAGGVAAIAATLALVFGTPHTAT
ncbi:hypothetical protein Q2100_11440, partial [Mycolicibacterium sp. KC 300]|nr:hypothetical protein [Mycolicibacterium arseniciresistens]